MLVILGIILGFLLMVVVLLIIDAAQQSFNANKWETNLSKHFKELGDIVWGRSREFDDSASKLSQSQAQEIFNDLFVRSTSLTAYSTKIKIAAMQDWYEKELIKFTKSHCRSSDVKVRYQSSMKLEKPPSWLFEDVSEPFDVVTFRLEEWRCAIGDLINYDQKHKGLGGTLKAFATGGVSGIEIAGGVMAFTTGNFAGGAKIFSSGAQRFMEIMSEDTSIEQKHSQSYNQLNEAVMALAIAIDESCRKNWRNDTLLLAQKISDVSKSSVQQALVNQ